MADFCNVCVQQFGGVNSEPENIGEAIVAYRFLSGGDIIIHDLFDKHMKDKIDELTSNELLALGVGGICEHCGLTKLSMRKDGDTLYLVAWCWKNDGTKKYDIGVVNGDELEYQQGELIKYYEEN